MVQDYWISSISNEGRIFQSSFSLIGKDAAVESNFSYLPKEVKKQIWDVVFEIKRKFFEDYKPDIVEHFIDQAHSVEKRFELYKSRLPLPQYEIEKTKHTIVYQKRRTPIVAGGGSSLLVR
ncbi:hypothetical protein A0257_13280 [Hymenobacter psoromatis]|nr:hypothetical protein A0257_13280 [Hymenobacter psoromatis]